MQKWLRDIALCFAAGCVGALAKTGVIWLCFHFSVLNGVASHLASAQYPAGFYGRIVWGGIGAVLFLLPVMRKSWPMRGLCWGLIAASLQLFVLPLVAGGTIHFSLFPMLSALTLGCVWGVATAAALRGLGA
ncbi:MAG: hypothetical protein QM709_06765 [Spongiibacteraceae bacterium]